jgi:hypothetical protein
MTQELFYTSAPRGLRPGSRGFCTVMSTSGMAKNLADRLEALSGYRHVFPPNDLNASLNPVVFSHLRINVGGVAYHVLSRIGAAGLDYTQRSNKFAHHVVLDRKELVPGGPAAVLANAGFMESTWQGEPRVVAAGRKPSSAQAPTTICRTWKQLAGDAGWAGVLAESATGPSSRVAAVIFKPGYDTLALVAEALALLPAPLRWQVTFSTYYTKLPPEIDCQWRFVLAGSPEAKALERSPHTLTIDLNGNLGEPPEGPWVEAARTGIRLNIASAERAINAAPPAGPFVPKAMELAGESSIGRKPLAVEWALSGHSSAMVPRKKILSKRRRVSLWVALAAMVAIASTALTGGGLAVLHYVLNDKTPKAANAIAAKQAAPNTTSEKTPQNTAPAVEPAKPSPIEQRPATLRKLDSEPPKPENAPSPPPVPQSPAVAASAGPTVWPIPDLLPHFNFEFIPLAWQVEPQQFPIGRPEGVKLSELTFDLLGSADVLSDGWVFVLDDSQQSNDQRRILIQAKKPGREFLEGAPVTIAVIHISAQMIAISRTKPKAEMLLRAHQLANCILKITYLDLDRYVAFRSPITSNLPLMISFDKDGNSEHIKSTVTWPRFPMHIVIPQNAAAAVASLGYSIVGNDSETIRLTPTNPEWPAFTLSMDGPHRAIQLAYEWTHLGPPDGTRGRLKRKRDQLVSHKDRLEGQEKDLEKTRPYKKDPKDIDSLNAALAKIRDKKLANNSEITLLNSVISADLEKRAIPYHIIMLVGDKRVVFVDAEAPQNDK